MEAAGLGPSLWQVAGALAAVLGLLVLALRGLQRLQGGRGADAGVRLLSVRRLGPRREIQRLRVGDTVHTIYRHDGAMVVLEQGPWREDAAPGAAIGAPAATAQPRWQARLQALMAAAGGASRSADHS